MPKNEPISPRSDFRLNAQVCSILAWMFVVGLSLNFVGIFGGEVGDLDFKGAAFVDAFNRIVRGVMLGLPTLLIALAVYDLARFFDRYEDGQLFTERNVKTIRRAGEGLFWAALASAFISPTIISWIDAETRGFVWDTNDLALGVAAMGVGLYGFANVLKQAVTLKEENDEMI